QIKQWKRDKNAAELIELRSELAEVDTKIENNPKHAQLAQEFRWGKDLGGSDETIISQMHEKPVFVTHYPKKAKAFYMKTNRSNEDVVLNFDLLAPAGFGEIIGGSVREDDHDRLIARIKEQGLKIPSQIRLGPARRIRTRHRTDRRLAHRPKTHPPVHPLPQNDGQGLYLTGIPAGNPDAYMSLQLRRNSR
ncbi:MAG: amino acid--tRNA ligase-related protein, partial [Planctomycetota bacterium]